MSKIPFSGLFQIGVFRSWKIKWPYRTERYLFFGTKANAEAAAKKLQGDWPYKPSIREVKL
jgi:hypothetical protein